MVERAPSTGRIVAGTVLAVGALALLGAVAVGSLSVYVARKVITPSKKRVEDIRILASTPTTITLSPTLDSLLPGTYSLWFARGSGHAKIGPIIETTPTSVTRELLVVDFGDLAASERGYLAGWVYLGPGELKVPYQSVAIDTPVGLAPAWVVPAEEETGRWLIGVHGRGVRKQECLRAVEVARRCGYTSLLVSYRNDGDAPPSGDGRYGLGDTEWQDVDSAIGYAIEHGAAEIVLMGWSMGGATVLQAVTRSANAGAIRGLILESPVIAWLPTLNYQAELMRIPKPVSALATGMLSATWSGRLTGQEEPIALDRLDFVSRAAELAVPVLLLHSADDGFVPPDASRALAAARPDIVTYDEFTVARHTKLWNYDPERWTNDIGTWLSRLT
jgi:alpha-beta hydrolase superfamily lysophospholipase